MKQSYVLFFLCSLLTSYCFSQDINFETTVPTNFSVSSGTLSISDAHYIVGEQSLKWGWVANDVLTIDGPDYTGYDPNHFYKATTNFFIHNEIPSNESIRFEFLDENDEVDYHFEVILNFKGWNAIARNYRFDMYRSANWTQDIKKIRVIAPTTSSGALFFDNWRYIGSNFLRMATPSMPDVHGLVSSNTLLTKYNYTEDIPLTTATASELADAETIKNRVINGFAGFPTSVSASAEAYYNSLNIVKTGNQIKGKQANPIVMGEHLLRFARDYHHNATPSSLEKVTDMLRLMFDSGYTGGSIRLVNKAARDYHTAMVLIGPHLTPELRAEAFYFADWGFVLGDFWNPSGTAEGNSDAAHLLYRYYLGFIATLMEPGDEQVRELKGFKRFLKRIHVPKLDRTGWFKADHTLFHHASHHNSYSYSVNTFVSLLALLQDTSYQIDVDTYKLYRAGVYSLIVMSNGNHYANSLSGRAPFSTRLSMNYSGLRSLASVGGSILGETYDNKIAGAYNRIYSTETPIGTVPPEPFPEGFWQFNYSPIGVYRNDNWVATMHGIIANFWGAEIYSNANRYGMYQSYGAVEIMYPGGLQGSGMQRSGYDWNRPPGTTTRVIPWTELNSTLGRCDERADSNYAAALRFDSEDNQRGKYGMYGFDFKQKKVFSSQDGTLKFKKTMFTFDNMIVCLGSNIECADTTNPINTTLFQSALKANTDPTVENGVSTATFPYNKTINDDVNWVMDSYNTGYYVNASDPLKISRTNQTSPTQDGYGNFTTADFAKAYIDHGANPTNSAYEFVILPNTTSNKMTSFKSNMETSGNELYEVVQKDDTAHIVHHKSSNIFGYAFFKQATGLTNTVIESVSGPSLIMLQTKNDKLTVTMVDPSVSYEQNSTINVVLNGEYSVDTTNNIVSLVNVTGGKTTLAFSPRNGEPVDITLTNLALSTTGFSKENNLLIYPNPSDGKITISSKTDELDSIKVFDMLGREITKKISISHKINGKVNIDLTNLSSGVYVIKTLNSASFITRR